MDEKASVSPEQTKCDWNSIDWKGCVSYVRKLRQQIYQATKANDLKKVRTLQRIMLRSYENRCMAVQRVTQDNRGKNTPGVDKLTVKTPEARGRLVDELAQYEPWKPLPAKRVYIPKANGKQRPLGIPVVIDRAIQAIVKNALEPYWEAKFEDSSYGFRPGRGCHDAIQRIYGLMNARGMRKWVLDADIKGAFDNIDHDKLLEAIGNFPARELIRQWLKAGYMEEGVFHDTEAGTPQGGVISPLLANIAFHGMEEPLGIRYSYPKHGVVIHEKSVALVRYADDFVVFCFTQQQALEVKEKLKSWFAERGLTFSEEKTRIRHIEEGFDFLGFNIRQYKVEHSRFGLKGITKPSSDSVKSIKRKLKGIFRDCHGQSAEMLIKTVNPVIRGWANYFRIGVSKRIFSLLDDYLFKLQKRWTRRQHPNKGWEWRKRYWQNVKGEAKWVFTDGEVHMLKFSWTPIQRHVVVQRFASWDDPELENYWNERKQKAVESMLTKFQQKIAKQQGYVCPICGDSLDNGEEVHEHHVVQRKDGGGNHPGNLRLVHLYCHQAIHGSKAGSIA